jgi:hypothetical protein
MFKVVEVSRTYRFDHPDTDGDETLGVAFERALLDHLREGYSLDSWRLDRAVIADGNVLDETIIAVFVREPPNDPA